MFQSWLKDILVYTIECHLSQWEAIHLVKDYTSEQARSEVEYYLGLTPKKEQSFQGLIDHLSLAIQSCEIVSFLIADFYNQFQKTRETEDAFANELQILVRKIVARKPEFIHKANQALKHQFAQNLRDPILEWWPGDSDCLPLTLKVLPNLGAGWPLCLIARGSSNMLGQM